MKNRKKLPYSTIRKATLIVLALCFAITLGVTFHIINNNSLTSKQRTITPECDHVRFPSAPINPSYKLEDRNDIHLLHAQRNGVVPPFKTDSCFNAQIAGLVRKSRLVKITENRFYQLKSLSYSQPYLIPEAVDMLNEIGVVPEITAAIALSELKNPTTITSENVDDVFGNLFGEDAADYGGRSTKSKKSKKSKKCKKSRKSKKSRKTRR